MQVEKQMEVLVFKVDNNDTFESIGEVAKFSSLVWPDAFQGCSTFELYAPATDENAELLKEGHIVWCKGENAAIIEIVRSSVDEDGAKKINVKGRTLEKLLMDRIIWGTVNFQNKFASEVMYSVVNSQCINPSESKRKIPFLVLDTQTSVGNRISIQKTGGTVYDFLQKIAEEQDIGYTVKFDPYRKRLVFSVYAGVDRTVEQDVRDPVEFSTELEDLLSSEYYLNTQDDKTIAWVQGEDMGTARKNITTGDLESYGFERKELYVDARDLQSETEGSTLSDAEYRKVLINRGKQKLAENITVENFEAEIRIFGDVQYKFGEDFKKGDKVTVRDKELNVIVSARITEVEETFSEKYALSLTFGYSYPTIMQKVMQSTVSA